MHTVTIIDSKQLSDGQLAVCARCDDDPTTDSWLTLHEVQNMSDTDIDTAIQDHMDRVVTRHEGVLRAKDKIATLQGLTRLVNQ